LNSSKTQIAFAEEDPPPTGWETFNEDGGVFIETYKNLWNPNGPASPDQQQCQQKCLPLMLVAIPVYGSCVVACDYLPGHNGINQNRF